ncbi:MAG TPA: RnfABCDGE type electron transport complex subunit A [Myxococcota bacterium]|nr:RnfABCDGE type electron transport complex subunit A [Myxococcota bacterium]HOD06856.1 RnfABCDGE type electron transport complex subunit A [Myxococcota bacterium]HPB51345.1 RnfABCDGE type electron transport complex subunit A [Myxococcota bacterium]HQP96608.1 RnfABCDGE type electron transport complex subunit A [Myxococcota bacterium]
MKMTLLTIIIFTVFVNNVILSQFLGICPFMGVSKKLDSALGMSAAVLFVIVLSAIISYLLQFGVLVPLKLEYLQTIMFILVIAALVQFVEMFIKKASPALFEALGIYLPLITTNCAVLGTAIMVTQKDKIHNLIEAVVFATGISLGFALVLLLFAAIRERLDLETGTPRPMKGLPIALVTASILSLAFLGFSGMVKM